MMASATDTETGTKSSVYREHNFVSAPPPPPPRHYVGADAHFPHFLCLGGDCSFCKKEKWLLEPSHDVFQTFEEIVSVHKYISTSDDDDDNECGDIVAGSSRCKCVPQDQAHGLLA